MRRQASESKQTEKHNLIIALWLAWIVKWLVMIIEEKEFMAIVNNLSLDLYEGLFLNYLQIAMATNYSDFNSDNYWTNFSPNLFWELFW